MLTAPKPLLEAHACQQPSQQLLISRNIAPQRTVAAAAIWVAGIKHRGAMPTTAQRRQYHLSLGHLQHTTAYFSYPSDPCCSSSCCVSAGSPQPHLRSQLALHLARKHAAPKHAAMQMLIVFANYAEAASRSQPSPSLQQLLPSVPGAG